MPETQFGRHCDTVGTEADAATVRLSASSVLDLARTLAGWGHELEVLEPSSLRDELGRIGRELAAAYPGGANELRGRAVRTSS